MTDAADDGPLHADRSRALTFGSDAELYDAVRPRYPEALFDALLVDLGTAAVLDVGCGTGIAARALAARGCRVLGLEPDERMAAVARASGIEVEIGDLETWSSDGRRFDLVTCAQAWHWIDPVVGIARVVDLVREGGRFAAFWNQLDHDPEVRDELESVYAELAPEVDRFSVALGRSSLQPVLDETIDLFRTSAAFRDVRTVHVTWARVYSREEWVGQLRTHSDHRRLPDEQFDRLARGVGDVVDARGGSIEVAYEASAVIAER